ncbi:MAG: NUDIX domain-containing protein [Candidatus Pacebacteria bacterium]|nr:NUDIX domain-containing protein [Candidatus Paceibacterota bacterium]MBP9715942.1 NUDIX domain-containing protein [Candidatus Paceibacterota bacterium]
MENNHIKVGVGVMVFKDGKVLMGKRKGKHGAGEYSWPGGHLEYMESIIECTKREVFEECGIEIKNIKFLRLLNMKKYDKHYIDIAMTADWGSGEVTLKEPEKCEGWDWYDINNLPEPLFAPLQTYFEALKTGKIFFDN